MQGDNRHLFFAALVRKFAEKKIEAICLPQDCQNMPSKLFSTFEKPHYPQLKDSYIQKASNGGQKSEPQNVYESALGRLLHKQETSFGSPKAVIYIAFHAPHCYSSPENAVLTQLYIRLLLDNLNELSYDAELAGLSYNAFGTTTGFLVSFAG